MSVLIKEIHQALNASNIETSELLEHKKKLDEEYNTITEEYRELYQKIETKMNENREKIVKNCNHKYSRISEYHNDRYFICNICGHEKY